MTYEFPTRGYQLLSPSNAETALTGHIATIQFCRRNHRYVIRFNPTAVCERDDKPISWEALPNVAKRVAHDAAKFLSSAA